MSVVGDAFDAVRWALFNHDVGRSYYRLPLPYLQRRWQLLGFDGTPPITPLGLEYETVEARGFGFHGWCLSATRCVVVLADVLGHPTELKYAKAEVDVKVQTKSQLGARMVHYWCEDDGVRIDPTWEQTVVFPSIAHGSVCPTPRGATQFATLEAATPNGAVPITAVEASLLGVAASRVGADVEVTNR
jgi:hypothetical protein